MKYIYLGDRLTSPEFKNKLCNPVLRKNGKCITGKSTMLVKFESGKIVNVLRYRLRKLSSYNPVETPVLTV